MQQSRLAFTQEIFRMICAQGSATRKTLADCSPRSLMSVGKAVDCLFAAGLITETTAPAAGSGRRAGLLAPCPGCIVIVDITTRHFTVEVFDLCHRCIAQLIHAYNEEIFFEENIYIFADRVGRFLAAHCEGTCIGVGLLVPGRYDPEQDLILLARSEDYGDLHPRAIFSDKLGGCPLLIEEDLCMGALIAANRAAPEAKNLLFMKIDCPLGAALVLDGLPCRGVHAGAGALAPLAATRAASSPKLSHGAAFSERLHTLAGLLDSFLTVFVPDAIVLESAEFTHETAAADTLRDILLKEFMISPQFLPSVYLVTDDGSFSKEGLSRTLTDRWVEKHLSDAKSEK